MIFKKGKEVVELLEEEQWGEGKERDTAREERQERKTERDRNTQTARCRERQRQERKTER